MVLHINETVSGNLSDWSEKGGRKGKGNKRRLSDGQAALVQFLQRSGIRNEYGWDDARNKVT